MPHDTGTAGRLRFRASLPPIIADNLDRILLGACAVIWLVALGAGVAATVALVDLGRGHPESSGTSGTPWPLYVVIVISAIVIVGAVPLLLRARRTALAEPRSAPVREPVARPEPAEPSIRGADAPTEKLRLFGTDAGQPVQGGSPPPAPSRPEPTAPIAGVDRLWLRCPVVIACSIGVAMVAIGVATYLMAVDSIGAAWVFYGVAGLSTVVMPVIPWFYLRQLRRLLDSSA